ncbi:hypothetical protein BJ085DRAFT_7223, partial [Dimargaris cristalligena]
FGCPLCPTDFTRPSDLDRHIHIHTGDKNFPCLRCGREFARKDARNRHTSSSNCSS